MGLALSSSDGPIIIETQPLVVQILPVPPIQIRLPTLPRFSHRPDLNRTGELLPDERLCLLHVEHHAAVLIAYVVHLEAYLHPRRNIFEAGLVTLGDNMLRLDIVQPDACDGEGLLDVAGGGDRQLDKELLLYVDRFPGYLLERFPCLLVEIVGENHSVAIALCHDKRRAKGGPEADAAGEPDVGVEERENPRYFETKDAQSGVDVELIGADRAEDGGVEGGCQIFAGEPAFVDFVKLGVDTDGSVPRDHLAGLMAVDDGSVRFEYPAGLGLLDGFRSLDLLDAPEQAQAFQFLV